MKATNRISIHAFCQYHGIESDLILTFQELGLVDTVEEESVLFFEEEELPKAERTVRLYREIGLSPEGIEVVVSLLDKIEKLQTENQVLRNKLKGSLI